MAFPLIARNGILQSRNHQCLISISTIRTLRIHQLINISRKTKARYSFKLFDFITFGNMPGKLEMLLSFWICFEVYFLGYFYQAILFCFDKYNKCPSNVAFSHSIFIPSLNLAKRNSIVFSQAVCLLSIQKQSHIHQQ